MTDAEKVEVLQSAIERADHVLDWILADPGHPEWMLTTAKRVRRILESALKKTTPKPAEATEKIKLPKVRLDLAAMKANGTLKETKRK